MGGEGTTAEWGKRVVGLRADRQDCTLGITPVGITGSDAGAGRDSAGCSGYRAGVTAGVDPGRAGAVWRHQRWVACGLAAGGPRVASDVAAVVARLGCVQAQEFDMTLWSLGMRTGQSREEVLRDLAAGEVVRTRAMRPTWHFIHREHLARVQAATAHRVHQVARPVYRSQGLDESTLSEWATWLTGQLRDGPLTRDQLKARLAGSRFAFDGMTLGFALMWAELELLIASGPPAGLVHTYQLVATGPRPDRDDSVRWLVERILASHGPSSLADICAWSGLTIGDVRRALSDLGSLVTSAEVLGEPRHWIGAVDEGGWPAEPTVALLNGFDEYISALHARSKSHLDPQGLYQVRRGTPFAVLMVDGTLAGHWRRTSSARSIRIDVQLLRTLNPDEQAGLDVAAEDLGQFTDLPATLTTTGP